MIALLLALFIIQTTPGQVTLAWDPNSEADLAGYRVYWGQVARFYTFDGSANYIETTDAGATPQACADAIRLVSPQGAETIIDNAAVGVQDAQHSFTGTWCSSTAAGFYGTDSLYSCGTGVDTYRWIPPAGVYEVYVRWTAHANRGTAIPISIHAASVTTRTIDEQVGGGEWVRYGNYSNTPPVVPVSTAPTYTVTGLAPGTYYFSVTAHNTTGLESGFSNEVSATITQPPEPPTGLEITSQSASLRWFGVVLLATTNEKASATLRYRRIEDATARYTTVIATPDPIRTQHRAVLYDLPAASHYSYEWTVTGADGTAVKGSGTFQTR